MGGGGPNGHEGFDSSIALNGQTLAIATGGRAGEVRGTASTIPGVPSIVRDGNFTTDSNGARGANAGVSLGPDGEHTGEGAQFGSISAHAFSGYVLITW